MAGIAGITDANNTEWVESALGKIEHRGGAGRTIRELDGAVLGQVWPTAQDHFAVGIDKGPVVLDGEIHNWTKIAAGATCALEAVETAYLDKGPEFLTDLDGPFAMAIAAPSGIFLARDPVGKSPLYFARKNGILHFGSEMKVLFGQDGDISEFPPGHWYHPDRGLVSYAKIETLPPLDIRPEEAAEELRTRLVAAVKKRLAGAEVGTWLSGGIDSATMTALARRQQAKLNTFAVGVAGAPDLEYARMVADYVDSQHHERTCTLEEMLQVLPEVIYHLESFDALLVRSSVTNYMVGKLASEHVAAVLSGEGGDELFGGYAYLKKLELAELPDELVDITRRLYNTALQRVDRCSASHGLVARTAFLDRDVLEFALQIPPHMKIYGTGDAVEKWILRQAMEGLLPKEVLTRPKSKFWEGAGVGELLSAHADEAIPDEEFARERTPAEGVTLNTKEELFHYRIFADVFGEAVDPSLVGRTKGAPVDS